MTKEIGKFDWKEFLFGYDKHVYTYECKDCYVAFEGSWFEKKPRCPKCNSLSHKTVGAHTGSSMGVGLFIIIGIIAMLVIILGK